MLKHPDRAEATRVWNFPYVAIEEAVVNAVYHRSYEEREPIEVRISYSNRDSKCRFLNDLKVVCESGGE